MVDQHAQQALRLVASKYYMLASCVILFYDYVLTLDNEVKNLWRRRAQWFTTLFLFNRYFPLVVYIVALVAVHNPALGGAPCNGLKAFLFLGPVLSEAVIAIIVILRLYALYSCNTWVVAILLPIYMTMLATATWASGAIIQAPGLPPGAGCLIGVQSNEKYRFAWLWGTAAVFDTVVFSLTICRTLNLRRTGLKMPLTTLFLRDGIVYYVVMFSVKLLNFVLFWTAITPDLITLNWTFNNTITVIMINRLILNLREESSTLPRVTTCGQSQTSRHSISETISAFGAPLGDSGEVYSDVKLYY